MSARRNAAFVLVHGGWHDHSAWDRVKPLLEAQGHAALARLLIDIGLQSLAKRERASA